ncbi:MAG TPA: ABC transporter permease [Gemmatimonadaceae bacterium]|nr:ABC transporter permease [Gemmatimonadaceae bacterium]
MPEYPRTRPRTRGEWIYRALLQVYPREFRDEFGDAMVEFFRDRNSAARAEGTISLVRLWWRVALDLLRNALPARADALVRSLRRVRDYHRAPRTAPSLGFLRQEDRMFATMFQDLRFALRGMRRAPGFTLTVLATLAIGIGASVTIFSVVNGVLLKPLPYPEPHRIVRAQHLEPFGTVSEPEFVDYKREAKAFALLAAYRTAPVTLGGTDGEPERIEAAVVSEDFFPVLSRPMALGRSYNADENRRGGPFTTVISHGLWQRRFGGDSSVIGRQIVVNERPRTVIGVARPGTDFPNNGISIWLPMRLNYDTLWDRNNHYLELIGRLAPNATVERAGREIQTLARRFQRDFPDMYGGGALITRVTPLSNVMVADAKPYIITLFGAVGFVLLIACVNVANLMLARGESRRKEIAIRSAMGASRARVTRQALTESLLFAIAGGVLGLLAAIGGVGALRALAPSSVPRVDEVAVDPMVMLFAIGVTLLTGMLFGMGPALRAVRDDAAESLKEGGKTSSGNARGLGRMRRTLAVSEIALAVVALSGGGMMMRSLWHLQAIDLGFRPDHVLAMRLAPPQSYAGGQGAALYDRILERVRALPDVEKAAAVEDLPITDGNSMWSILVDGAPQTSVAKAPVAMPQKVTPDYFETMGIRLLRGRSFTEADRPDAQLVAVVNETMEKKLWPGKSAIGGTVKLLSEQMPWATVVGVVRDVRSRGFLEEIPPTMYFAQAQAGRIAFYVPHHMWILARTRGEPSAITASVRAIVREIEPATPIARVQTMDEAVAASVASRRFTTSLIAGFAAIAVLLAGLGVYGVITYSVNQRQFEMGIRMALGATRSRVVNHILREGLWTGVTGAAIGLVFASGATRLLRATLVEVKPGDPLTLVVVTLVLLSVAMLASWIPARRASAVDPVRTIRAE